MIQDVSREKIFANIWILRAIIQMHSIWHSLKDRWFMHYWSAASMRDFFPPSRSDKYEVYVLLSRSRILSSVSSFASCFPFSVLFYFLSYRNKQGEWDTYITEAVHGKPRARWIQGIVFFLKKKNHSYPTKRHPALPEKKSFRIDFIK
jgi:hypothetical protein